MPRGERPLDEGDGPLLRFAADLRKLREQAGSPVYRELSRRAHYSTAVLSEAAGGRKLPSLAVTLAYVTACEGDTVRWERRWREVSAELAPVETPQSVRSPYLGPAAFDVADADRFFGRDALLDELAAAVGEHRLVAVHGAAGTGKSSLLRAGLAARDRRRAVVFTPGPHPIEECAVQLAVIAGWSAPRLRDELAADPANLHLRIRQAVADDELLLVIDQFEETFTACVDETERATFLAALIHAATAGTSRCRIVLGVRADFLDRCEEERALRAAHLFPMRAMTTDELREAVTKPALAAGLTLETALVARVIADASHCGGALPLVSRALKETWQRRQGMTLTLAGYDEVGGVRHAVARAAESVYLSLDPAERDIARQIFLRLTAFGDGAEDTKRRVGRRELDDGPRTAAVLAELVRSRLVTVGRHDMELTHEALLVTWPRLREWLSEDRDGLRTHRQLTEAADAWLDLDRDPGALYRGLRLLIAEDWVNRAKPVLSRREREFFTTSLYAEHDRQHVDRKRTRRLRQLVALLVMVLLVTVFIGVTAFVNSRQQFRQQAVQNVVSQVPALDHTDPYLAGQLALAAYRLDATPQSIGQLLSFAAQRYPLAQLTRGAGAPAVAVDANAHLVACVATDGSIILVQPSGMTAGSTFHAAALPATGVTVDSLALSADGQLLVVSYADGTLDLWDVSKPYAPARTWSAHHGMRVLVSFDRTGRTFAAGGHPSVSGEPDPQLAAVDLDTTVFDAADPRNPSVVATLPRADGPVTFSADDRTITTLSPLYTAQAPQVWRQIGGRWTQLPATAPAPAGNYVGATVSADGTLVAAVTGDLREPRTSIWQVQDGKLTQLGTLSTAPMATAPAFGPGNRQAASIEADGTILVSSVDRPDQPVKTIELSVAPSKPRAVFFQPDGRLVVVADDAVGIWSLRPDYAAGIVCGVPRDELISRSRWDSYFTGMDVPMPCDN